VGRMIGCAVGLAVLVLSAVAQEDIQQGKIKKVDPDKGVLTVVSEGKELELHVTDQTKVWGPDMQELSDRLRDRRFREGASVQFKTARKDGKNVLFGLKLGGQGRPERPGRSDRARIKKVDAGRMTITLTIDGKDQEFTVSDDTRILNVPGQNVKEQLGSKELKEGAEVQFRAATRGGKQVLVGLRLGGRGGNRPALPPVDTSRLKPLTEMGTEKYQGYEGGLYPGGKNERPATHEAAGVALGRKVQPLDSAGKPSADGKIVLLSVGMSNTTQEFSLFKQLADRDKQKNPHLVIVDGAQGGMTAARIKDPQDNGGGTRFWTTVDQRLKAAGVTRDQVQVAWIKEADAGPSQGFPRYARTLQEELAQVVRLMHERFPNLKLVYLSSRIYAGYARSRLNPEPYAYESAFSVRWLIEQQLKGEAGLNFDPGKGKVQAPWLSWGPYLWANGKTKRADGLTYEESDFGGDGTHPAQSGRRKVAEQLLQFLKTDTTTRPWFVRNGGARSGR
jgi:Cu/Ag efflux protein CusF